MAMRFCLLQEFGLHTFPAKSELIAHMDKESADARQAIHAKFAPWSTGIFSSKADSIQEDTRWRCFYVDWHDKERYWKYEFFVADKDRFSKAISVLIKNISQECRVSS